jgi:hypothetical protein
MAPSIGIWGNLGSPIHQRHSFTPRKNRPMLQRPSTFAITKALLLLVSHLPSLHSRPVGGIELFKKDGDGFPEEDPSSAAFWWKLGISLVLVLLGGVFAGKMLDEGVLIIGLTLALLSQDEITVTHFLEDEGLMVAASS